MDAIDAAREELLFCTVEDSALNWPASEELVVVSVALVADIELASDALLATKLDVRDVTETANEEDTEFNDCVPALMANANEDDVEVKELPTLVIAAAADDEFVKISAKMMSKLADIDPE